MKRVLVVGLTLALGLGVLATESMGAGAKTVTPLVAPMSSTVVKCTNISGFIKTNPGITNAPIPVGAVAAFKWKLKAVATGCTAFPTTAAGYSGTIAGAIITENGFVNDPLAPSTCAAALGAPGSFGGVSGSRIQWISTPAAAMTVLPPATLGAPAEIDSTGLEIFWPITGTTSFEFGGDWPTATPCPAGPSPSTLLSFGSPSTHLPVFVATL